MDHFGFVSFTEKQWSLTIKEYPIPNMDRLEELGIGNNYSSLNCQSGFLKIEMDLESQDKTAFMTSSGICKFIKMQFSWIYGPFTLKKIIYYF